MASRYPFEYFAGANTVVYLDNFPLLECAGFSYEISESKRPIYGYASRLYDAIARGQVIVQGTLLINYVHQDYLFRAAQIANNQLPAETDATRPTSLPPNTEGQRLLEGVDPTEEEIAEAVSYYWDAPELATLPTDIGVHETFNMHDAVGGFNLRVVFGEQGGAEPSGKTGVLLTGVSFTGSGKRIEVDAETIVEAYSFFARNAYSLKAAASITAQPDSAGGASIDITRNR